MACNCLPHQVARSTARTAEGIAKDAQSAASREVDVIKGKLQTVEKQRSALRAEVSASSLRRAAVHASAHHGAPPPSQVNALTAELEAEKRMQVLTTAPPLLRR